MVNVKETCRDLGELSQSAQLACRLLFQECYKAGIKDIFITETYRSQERQNYLWEQGRTRPGKPVTWTLTSNHKSRRAWDIAVAPPKSLYDLTTLNKVGVIAKRLGITWGGIWVNNIDRPHFEISTTWTPPKGYKLEGTVIVPSNSSLKVQLVVKDKKEEVVMMGKFNPGSTSLQEGAEKYLEQAIKDGTLKDPEHLADLRAGVMTTDRLLGLFMTAEQRRNKQKLIEKGQ